jgi:hypothetical protein
MDKILKTGLKRMGVALFTAALYALAVFDFIAVATAPGYLAVLLLIVALMLLGMAFILTYAQGLTKVHEESQGEDE